MKLDHPSDQDIDAAVMQAADGALAFRRWPAGLRAIWHDENDRRLRRELIFINAIGMALGLLCLPFDYLAGPQVFETALTLRVGLVAPVYLMAMFVARYGSPSLQRVTCLLPVPCFATVGAYLGMHTINPYMSEYVMASGLLIMMTGVILPLRPACLFTISGLALGALWLVFLTMPHPAQANIPTLLAFISVICVVTLAIPVRTTRLRDQHFLLELRSRLMSARLIVANRQLSELSHRDELTGLRNRRYFERVFESALETSIARDDELAVMMIDVDHFKAFNDTHGHMAGDRALRQVARQLEREFAAGGYTLARYGGEEFVVVVEDSDVETALQLADRARQAVSARPVTLDDDRSVRLTVSVGVAMRKVAGSTASALMGRADEALYEAKQAGRDLVRLARKGDGRLPPAMPVSA